jgi:hypothetical protein
MIASGVVGVSPEWDMGVYGRKRVKMGDEVVFRHKNNTQYIYDDRHTGYIDIDCTDFDNPEQLVVGGVASSALHLAYRLGATTIICAGLDGGTLDGTTNIRSYTPHPTEAEHIYEMQPQIDLVCNMIRSKGVGVYSLNPWNNFTLEGHIFKPSMV